MNSVSLRRSRISLVAMIVGGLLAVAPVFGPLGKTLHYLGCSCLPYRWFYLSEVAREPRRAHESDVRI